MPEASRDRSLGTFGEDMRTGKLIAVGLGVALAVGHALLVYKIIAMILSGREPDWPMLWLLLLYVDLPYSIIATFLQVLIGLLPLPQEVALVDFPSPANDVPNFIVPFVLFGVGGTIWWLFLPELVRKLCADLISRFHGRKSMSAPHKR